MWVSSLSELVPVDPSGSVTHWKNFTGEGGEGDGEGGVKEGRPYFLCQCPCALLRELQYTFCLSERDRSVSDSPIISGRSSPQCQQTAAPILPL